MRFIRGPPSKGPEFNSHQPHIKVINLSSRRHSFKCVYEEKKNMAHHQTKSQLRELEKQQIFDKTRKWRETQELKLDRENKNTEKLLKDDDD